MIKKYILFLIMSALVLTAFSQKRKHHEVYYQDKFAEILISQGIPAETEVTLSDRTRCDIVIDEYAIEVDFASKWAESIGQSLHYGILLNKKPGVLLILEDLDKDIKYLDRLKNVAFKHGIDIWIISEDINWRKIENE